MENVSSPPSNLEEDATTLNKHKSLGFRGKILRKPQRHGPSDAYRRRLPATVADRKPQNNSQKGKVIGDAEKCDEEK